MKSWRRAEREEEKGLHPREKVSALLRESGVARAPGAAACQKKMDTKMPGAQVSDGPNVRRPERPTPERPTARRPKRPNVQPPDDPTARPPPSRAVACGGQGRRLGLGTEVRHVMPHFMGDAGVLEHLVDDAHVDADLQKATHGKLRERGPAGVRHAPAVRQQHLTAPRAPLPAVAPRAG